MSDAKLTASDTSDAKSTLSRADQFAEIDADRKKKLEEHLEREARMGNTSEAKHTYTEREQLEHFDGGKDDFPMSDHTY